MAIQQKMGSLKEGETISRFEIIDNQVTLRTVLAKASVSSGKTRYLGFIAVNEPSRELLIEQLNIQTEPLPKWLGVDPILTPKPINWLRQAVQTALLKSTSITITTPAPVMLLKLTDIRSLFILIELNLLNQTIINTLNNIHITLVFQPQ